VNTALRCIAWVVVISLAPLGPSRASLCEDQHRELIVKVEQGRGGNFDQQLTQLLDQYGLQQKEALSTIGAFVVRAKSIEAANSLVHTPPKGFAYIKLNYISFPATAPSDVPASQWHLAQIHADEAWTHTQGDSRWVAAIIDSGVDTEHPALKGRFWINPHPGSSGFSGDANGVNFRASPPDGNIADGNTNGHGTHIAGIIAADDGRGLRAFVPNARLMILRVGDDCLDPSAAVKAIHYAATNGAAVANLSWDVSASPELLAAIKHAPDVLFVAAGPGDTGQSVDGSPTDPISAHLPNVIAVTGTDSSGAYIFPYGTRLDIAAPAKAILSTLPNDRYGTMSGTSMAAPLVVGTALLLKSLAPKWSAQALKHYIVDSADGPFEPRSAFRRLDAARATAPPIQIDWPAADATIDPHASYLLLKWHALFSSSACRSLDADLVFAHESVPIVRNRAVDANVAEYRVDHSTSGLATLRVYCSDTDLATKVTNIHFVHPINDPN